MTRACALGMTAVTACVLVGCDKSAPVPKVPEVPGEAECIVWLSRCLETGKFEPYVIDDTETVNRIREALADDLKSAIYGRDVAIAISEDNWVELIGKGGGAQGYSILGDSYLYVDGTYFSARRTMAALRAAQAAGVAERVSDQRAKTLTPEAEDYLNR